MITRIHINGFKTFLDFDLTLGPFQVIVGANGTGKSNLFDALHLLAQLGEKNVYEAFQAVRGNVEELFTLYPDSASRSSTMKLVVELFINSSVRDEWGTAAELKYLRLRYEVQIERRDDSQGIQRLFIAHEDLRPIKREDDAWLKRYLPKNRIAQLPKLSGGRSPFISTDHEQRTISLHQDGRSGKQNRFAERAERTVLSGVDSTEFPHVFAVRQEMRSWRFLHLNPDKLRQPDMLVDPTTIDEEGRHLPNTLNRLFYDDALIANDIARDLANFVPGIRGVQVVRDDEFKRHLIRMDTVQHNTFSAQIASDGTLRILALIALKHDPAHHGVLCFEEPENGIHPGRLAHMAHLLRHLATDFKEDEPDTPLRQLLLNTHSPAFIALPNIWDSVLYARTVERVDPAQQQTVSVTAISPTDIIPGMETSETDTARKYTLAQVQRVLEESGVTPTTSP